MAKFVYNNKAYTSTKMSPFEANNGQNPRMGFELRKKGKFEGAEKFATRMKEVQDKAKCHKPTRLHQEVVQHVFRGRKHSEDCRNRRQWTGLCLRCKRAGQPLYGLVGPQSL